MHMILAPRLIPLSSVSLDEGLGQVGRLEQAEEAV